MTSGPTPSLTVLSVAPLHWMSGYDDLLMAIASLVRDGVEVTLRVEAEGPAEERFRYTVDDLGLDGRVSLHPTEVTATARADVLALTAVAGEPWPRALTAFTRVAGVLVTDLATLRDAIDGLAVPTAVVPRRSPESVALGLGELSACLVR